MARRKKNKDLKPLAWHSDKIIANYNKLYKIDDPEQLSYIFFPSKNASYRRAAFIAIFFEIRNASLQKLNSLDHIPEKFDLSRSAVWKARNKMVSLGLIRKREGFWQFSTVFCRGLEKLMDYVETYQFPVHPKDQDKVFVYVDLAKGEKKGNQKEKSFLR